MSNFDELLNELQKRMVQSGHPVKVVSKDRTQEEQSKLYSQGRSSQGPIVTEKSGAPGDESRHQLGTAADFAFSNPGDQSWDLLGKNAKDLGLTWGGDWKSLVDKPHVELNQMPDQNPVVITDPKGNRHVFPPGFDPIKAQQIVNKTINQIPIPPAPTEGAAQPQVQAQSKSQPDQPGALTKFLGEFGSTINPMNMVRSIPAMIPGTDANAQATLAGLKEKAAHPIFTAIKQSQPLTGGAGVDAGRKIGSGDVAGGLGQASGDVFNAALPVILPEVPGMAKGAAKAVGTVAKKTGPVIGGAGVGAFLGGPMGALEGAAIGLGGKSVMYGRIGRILKVADAMLNKAEGTAGSVEAGTAPTAGIPYTPQQIADLKALKAAGDPGMIKAYEDGIRSQRPQAPLQTQPQQQQQTGLSKSKVDLVSKIEAQDKAAATKPAEAPKTAPAAPVKETPKDTPAPVQGRWRVGPDKPYKLDDPGPPNLSRGVPSPMKEADLPRPTGTKLKFEKSPSGVDPREMDTQQGLYKDGFRRRSFGPAEPSPNPLVEALIPEVRANPAAGVPRDISPSGGLSIEGLGEGYKGTLPEEVSGPMDGRKSLSRVEMSEWLADKAKYGLTDKDLPNWLYQKMMEHK